MRSATIANQKTSQRASPCYNKKWRSQFNHGPFCGNVQLSCAGFKTQAHTVKTAGIQRPPHTMGRTHEKLRQPSLPPVTSPSCLQLAKLAFVPSFTFTTEAAAADTSGSGAPTRPTAADPPGTGCNLGSHHGVRPRHSPCPIRKPRASTPAGGPSGEDSHPPPPKGPLDPVASLGLPENAAKVEHGPVHC